MAFQAASALPGLSASAVDVVPSLSSLAAPLRSLSRRTPPKSSHTTPASTEPPSSSTSDQSVSTTHTTQAVFNEAFDILASHPRYRPHAQALKHDYTVQNAISRGTHDARHVDVSKWRQGFNPSGLRSFSTSSLTPFALHSHPSLRHGQHRMMSTNQPSQNALANMELTANNNPQSASSQNAFYSSLLRANMPQILVERYETGRYATNAACDAMYYRALERMGQSGAGAQMAHGAQMGAQSSSQGLQGMASEQYNAMKGAIASSRGGSAGNFRQGQQGTGARSSPMHVVVDESGRSYIFRAVKFILVFGLVGYISLCLISFAFEASGVFRKAGGSQNAEVKPEEQKTRFADVKGCDEAIEELQEVVDFLRNPDKYNNLGGKLPKGVLMVGPPGTGKTLLARAVAGEAGVPFFYMSGSEFDEVYVGVGAKRVRELFTNAKSKAPAIVFIDELDAVGGKRNERDAAYHMQTLNQMLTELDGFDQTSGVVFIGATNFPQMLDKALTRPGRFDRQVVVPLPDVRGRMAILKHHMRDMQIDAKMDVSAIARGSSGFSGADLENLVNQAAVHASKNSAKKVGMADLDWARDRIIMGAEKKTMVIQEKDKLMTAYHEAGHALMGHFTVGTDPLYKVTILPRGHALGVTHFMPDLDKVSQSKRECLAQIDMAMGGKVAEELIYGAEYVTSGCSSDLTNATHIAYAMVKEWGMSDVLGSIAFDDRMYASLSAETKHKVEAEVRRILDESQDRARKLLGEKKGELELLARGLMKHETLTREEMGKVIVGEALPLGGSSLSGRGDGDGGVEAEQGDGGDDGESGIPQLPVKIPEIALPSGFGGKASKEQSGQGKEGEPPQIPGTDGAGQ